MNLAELPRRSSAAKNLNRVICSTGAQSRDHRGPKNRADRSDNDGLGRDALASARFTAISAPAIRRAAFLRLGQRHLFPHLLEVVGHDRPSEGLRPLWRVELDLERACDSRQHHAT